MGSDFAVEFLDKQWTTYALAHLQSPLDGGEPEEVAKRVDLLSAALHRAGTKAATSRAIGLLTEWLGRPESKPTSTRRRLQLRLVLYCHAQRMNHGYAQALRWLEPLRAEGPRSVALDALRANILGYLGRTDEAIAEFDDVIASAPLWVEPQLERIEMLIRKGEWQSAWPDAASLWENSSLNQRERLIAGAMLLVARSASDQSFGGGPEFQELVSRLEGINVPADEREEWKFGAVKQRLHLASAIPPDFKTVLDELLGRFETRLRPPKQDE